MWEGAAVFVQVLRTVSGAAPWNRLVVFLGLLKFSRSP